MFDVLANLTAMLCRASEKVLEEEGKMGKNKRASKRKQISCVSMSIGMECKLRSCAGRRALARARPVRRRAFTVAPGAAAVAHTFLQARALIPLPSARGGSADGMGIGLRQPRLLEGENKIARCDLLSVSICTEEGMIRSASPTLPSAGGQTSLCDLLCIHFTEVVVVQPCCLGIHFTEVVVVQPCTTRGVVPSSH